MADLSNAVSLGVSHSASLQAALDLIDQGFTLIDGELRMVAWNKTFLSLLDFPSRLARVGAPFEDFIRYNAERGEYGEGDIQALVTERMNAARHFHSHDFERTRPDGRVLRVRGMPLAGHGFVTLYSDVTEQRRAERELQEHQTLLESRVAERTAELQLSEAQMRLITDSIPALIAYFDHRRVYRYINRGYHDWFGLDTSNPGAVSAREYLGAATYESIRPNVSRALAGEAVTFEYAADLAGGGQAMARTTLIPDVTPEGKVSGCFELTFDITEERRAQEMLVQAQKMEALGQLTGGLAHDFNNILTVIIGNLGALSDARAGDPAVAEFVAPAVDAARRGSELIKALLSFSRQQPLEAQAVDVVPLAASIGRLVRRSLPENLWFEVLSGQAPVWAWADAHQLQNALLNLIFNARDATPPQGRISLSTRLETLSGEGARRLKVEPGDYVRIEVADSGTGMDEKTLARVFEPFFTTKRAGQGTGLGMAMVYGFVTQSGGAVAIASELGVGTSVSLWLPACEPGGESGLNSDWCALPEGGQRGLALLVEDDAEVRMVARRMLLEIGYAVVEASKGSEAMQILEQTPHIRLLLTDVVMPGGIDGRELAVHARDHCGVPKVLLMSGYAPAMAHGLDVPMLAKPFTKAQLVALIGDGA